MNKEQLIDAVRDYLDEEGFRYEYNAEKNFLKLGFNVKCKLKSVRVFWEFREHSYLVYSVAPINADKDNLGEIMKYLTMANFGLVAGNFELDCRDGEVRYKSFVDAEGLEKLSHEVIDRSLDVCLAMMQRYGDGIAALVMGFSDADTEIKKVEGED